MSTLVPLYRQTLVEQSQHPVDKCVRLLNRIRNVVKRDYEHNIARFENNILTNPQSEFMVYGYHSHKSYLPVVGIRNSGEVVLIDYSKSHYTPLFRIEWKDFLS